MSAAPRPAPLVLVVEDDHGVRALLETVLAAEGFEVACARDGLEGLVKLRMRRPAALVLDLMMPDVEGMRVLDELDEEHADVPVVVVTGKPSAGDRARDRLGPDNVFDKPFDVDQLVARLRQLAGVPGAGGEVA